MGNVLLICISRLNHETSSLTRVLLVISHRDIEDDIANQRDERLFVAPRAFFCCCFCSFFLLIGMRRRPCGNTLAPMFGHSPNKTDGSLSVAPFCLQFVDRRSQVALMVTPARRR